MRLAKYMSRCGAASRRGAEKIIARGRVEVNGQVTTDPATGIDGDTDRVTLDGKEIQLEVEFVYYAVNKPVGYHCTVKDPHAAEKVTQLVPASPRVYPVGRLDADSEGLIILTNDGDLTYQLTHPGFEHEKEYQVWVKLAWGVDPDSLDAIVEKMAQGMDLGDVKTGPCSVKIIKRSRKQARLSIILKEGKKRQIRRMCVHSGLLVVRLVRVRVGNLVIGGLKSGEYRKVKKKDII